MTFPLSLIRTPKAKKSKAPRSPGVIYNGVPCKVWPHALTRAGYGQIARNGKRHFVHRLSYEDAFGPIPSGKRVLHHCDNPACYEPKHLFLGTQKDNIADMWNKGRARGQFPRNTHCPKGHPLNGENLMIVGARKSRRCRICNNTTRRNRRRKYAALGLPYT